MQQAIPYGGGRRGRLPAAAIAGVGGGLGTSSSSFLDGSSPFSGPSTATASTSSSGSVGSCGMSAGGAVGGIRSLVAENPVLILSRGGCCMCHVVKRLLLGLGVNPVVCELDEDREEAAIMEELTGAPRSAERHQWLAPAPPQLPAVFIGGRFVGGLDRLMAAHISGDLVPILKDAGALWL
ncbi:unnamed protein product [Spirodela intermedia]|uniref:Glutaredoxin domain-containing protein n=1 Tax=Spirodela intermedia TaxID=51605 RepID=A0A7I8KZP0_SPIIN|nr:unnamed protein product [Spirodela intermedia]